MTDDVRKIEALLFLAGEPVSFNELARLIQKSGEETRSCVKQLVTLLAGHGLALIQTDTHVQLATSTLVSDYLQQFLQGEAAALSTAAAETLAIIAYRGPISRIDIEAIRGVDCRRMLRQLIARGLIRRERHGTALPTYSVTEDFLQHVGMTSREELPDFASLSMLKPSEVPSN